MGNPWKSIKKAEKAQKAAKAAEEKQQSKLRKYAFIGIGIGAAVLLVVGFVLTRGEPELPPASPAEIRQEAARLQAENRQGYHVTPDAKPKDGKK